MLGGFDGMGGGGWVGCWVCGSCVVVWFGWCLCVVVCGGVVVGGVMFGLIGARVGSVCCVC